MQVGLGTGARGGDVSRLQRILASQGQTIDPGERERGEFGPSTLAAVQQFQQQHTLPASGIVDPATTAAINAAVNAQSPPTFTVSGRIYSGLSAAVGGLSIQVVDKDAGTDVLLTTAVAGNQGIYSVRYSPAAALQQRKTAPRYSSARFRRWQARGRLRGPVQRDGDREKARGNEMPNSGHTMIRLRPNPPVGCQALASHH
jgi:peptidoglycan hydrolase-like protein with peptidoglycan-binding domain